MFIEEYKNMFNILIHPTEYFRKLKNTDLTEGVKYTTLGTIIPGILALILITLGMGATAAIFKAGAMGTATGFVGGLIALISLIVINIIVLLVGGTILWVIAKIFGMKKSIKNFIGVYGIILGINAALGWIPLIGGLIGLYAIYLVYVMLKEAMEMESGKATLTIIAPMILAIIIGIIVVVFIGMGALTAIPAM